MLIIFLPGYSLKNKDEMLNICSTLRGAGYQTLEHEWRHWSNEADKWDVDIELDRITEELIKYDDNEIILIGKSLGSYIAINLVNKLGEKLKKLILMGIPFKGLEDSERNLYIKVLSSLAVPMTLIQNSADHLGAFDVVKDFLQVEKVNFIEKEAEGHSYNYPQELVEIIRTHQ